MSFKEIHILYSETVSLHDLQSPPAVPPLFWGFIDSAIWLPQNTFILWVTLYIKKKIALTLLAIWHDSVEERQKKSEDNTADPWTTLSLGLQNPSNPWAVKNSFITSSFITSCVYYFLSSAIHIHGSTSRFNQSRIQPTMDLVVL